MKKKGIVYLVGAGPGDSELITVKGMRLLRDCEVVIYDRLASQSFLEEVPKSCEKINVGKRVGAHAVVQDKINEILVKKAQEGKRVVRLKGGDPFVFGRGGEEIMALEKEKIPYEVVPGVTSAIAAAAYAGIPITHRGISQSFHVITGYTIMTESGLTDNFNTLAALEGTLVFLMGMGSLERITSGLMANGKDPKTPAAIISRGTTSFQKSIRGTLDTICEEAVKAQLEAPAAIVIGETARLNFLYTGKEKLVGSRIGIAATHQLSDKLAYLLQQQGAKVEMLGGSLVHVYEENTAFKEATDRLYEYSWVVLTSTNGVKIFFEQLKQIGIDLRRLAHLKFAVIGSGTREALRQQGIHADYMPERYTAEDLAKGLVKVIEPDEKVLMPRAEKGSKLLNKLLIEANIAVDDIKTYDLSVDKARLKRRLTQAGKLDYLVFASSSGVESFIHEGGEKADQLLRESKLVCLGDITAETLIKNGYKELLVADDYTAEGVVEKILTDREAER